MLKLNESPPYAATVVSQHQLTWTVKHNFEMISDMVSPQKGEKTHTLR